METKSKKGTLIFDKPVQPPRAAAVPQLKGTGKGTGVEGAAARYRKHAPLAQASGLAPCFSHKKPSARLPSAGGRGAWVPARLPSSASFLPVPSSRRCGRRRFPESRRPRLRPPPPPSWGAELPPPARRSPPSRLA